MTPPALLVLAVLLADPRPPKALAPQGEYPNPHPSNHLEIDRAGPGVCLGKACWKDPCPKPDPECWTSAVERILHDGVEHIIVEVMDPGTGHYTSYWRVRERGGRLVCERPKGLEAFEDGDGAREPKKRLLEREGDLLKPDETLCCKGERMSVEGEFLVLKRGIYAESDVNAWPTRGELETWYRFEKAGLVIDRMDRIAPHTRRPDSGP